MWQRCWYTMGSFCGYLYELIFMLFNVLNANEWNGSLIVSFREEMGRGTLQRERSGKEGFVNNVQNEKIRTLIMQ